MAGLTREQKAERAATKEAMDKAEETIILGVEGDDTPRIDVLERRLQNPFGQPAAQIRLRDASQFPRWFSSALFEDRIWQAKQQGWRGVKPDEIVDMTQIGNYGRSPDGYVTRGERGQEVLMCMPRTYWDRLVLAKTKKNLELMRDTSKQQAMALEAAAAQMGDRVAESMRGVSRKMEIHDQYERIERTPGAED